MGHAKEPQWHYVYFYKYTRPIDVLLYVHIVHMYEQARWRVPAGVPCPSIQVIVNELGPCIDTLIDLTSALYATLIVCNIIFTAL